MASRVNTEQISNTDDNIEKQKKAMHSATFAQSQRKMCVLLKFRESQGHRSDCITGLAVMGW